MKELSLNELDLVVGGSMDGKISSAFGSFSKAAVPSRGGVGGLGHGGISIGGSINTGGSMKWNGARMKRENNFDKNGNQTSRNASGGRSRREGGGRATEK